MGGLGSAEWARLLERQDGVVSRRQALTFTSAKVVDRHLSSRRWSAPHRGVFVTHNGPLTERQRLWVASLAGGSGRPALLGGVSALTILGLRKFTAEAIDVVLPACRRNFDPPAGVRIHRTSTLVRADIEGTARPPCTSAARSMVDAARWARSDREARTIIAMCFQQRLVAVDDVDGVLGRMPNARRRTLTRATVADVAAGSETVTELDLARLCREAGLPVPSRQAIRRDADGRTRYLDAYFDEWAIVIEVDGAHHMDVDQWWHDMDRHNALSIQGERLLRFPAFLVRDQPARVAAVIRDALHKAGWNGHR